MNRRKFIETAAIAGVATVAGGGLVASAKPAFQISLAEWSLNKALFGKKLDHLDFPKTAKNDFGINAVEYVNQFFPDKAKDTTYLGELKKRCHDLGVESRLIMIDGEGALGDPDEAKRKQAVENHYKWVEAAKFLGCKIIRVNAQSTGTYEEQMKLAADGLHRLTEFGASHDIDVIVENHGGLSSNGAWLAGVMKMVNHKRCGTLPDFGNFELGEGKEYDKYKGVAEMMPYAKAVSAKSFFFDEKGNETTIDYPRMMKIVTDAGYHSFVGIEFEGEKMSEPDGIKATKAILMRILNG